MIGSKRARFTVTGVAVFATVLAGALAAGPASADDGSGRPASEPVKITSTDRALLAAENAGRKATAYASARKALGVYADPATSQYVIRIGKSSATTGFAAGDLRSAGVDATRVQRSRYEAGAVTALTKQLTARAWHPSAQKYAYAFHYDAKADTFRVSTNAPAEVTGALREAGAAVTYDADTRRDSRQNDGPPHWGGSSITSGGAVCSSGFVVQNGGGTRFMVTAAHCFGLGAAVSSTGGGGTFGTVTNRGPFPTWDLELLGGASYGSYIYTGNSTGTGTHVIGAGDPAINFTGYCRSGQTTFENCGQTVTSLTGQFCDASGCTPGLIVYSGGGSSAGGDSGAPFYLPGTNGVWIRGVHIARSGGTMYAEKWSTVAAHFGVTIVT